MDRDNKESKTPVILGKSDIADISKDEQLCPHCSKAIKSWAWALCADCKRKHHLDCWTSNYGCGQEGCKGELAHFCLSKDDEPGGDHFVEADGSQHFRMRFHRYELILLLTMAVGLVSMIPPFFWWTWVWLEPIANFLFFAPIIPYLLLRFGLRRRIVAYTASKSLDMKIELFKFPIWRVRGFLFSDETIEIQLILNDESASTKGGEGREVETELRALQRDCTIKSILRYNRMNLNEMLHVSKSLATILDCPIRRLSKREELSQGENRKKVEKWKDDKK